MFPAIRSTITALPTYVEGKMVPGSIKLASNETTFGPLPSVKEAIVSAAGRLNRYPDNGYKQLRASLAKHLGFPASQIAAGCGSVSLCQQLIQICCNSGDEVVFGWRSFELYPLQTLIAGAIPIRIPLSREIFDLSAIMKAINKRTRLIFICNPNNPTSTVVDPGELVDFISAVPPHVLIVIDEAYIEYVQENLAPPSLELVRQHPNVVVLRTFSKAYGLAGLRLGYAIASSEIIQQLNKVYVPFSVSSLAQEAGIACLEASEELLARVSDVVSERNRVSSALRDFGYSIPKSQANFIWLPLGEHTMDFAHQAGQNHIIVRPFAADGVRVTISSPEENDTFLQFSQHWIRNSHSVIK